MSSTSKTIYVTVPRFFIFINSAFGTDVENKTTKKMKKVNFILLIALIAILTSCQKEPTAIINSSATSCYVGESIKFTSISTDADHVKWTSSDGQTYTTNSIDLTFNSAGTKTINLEAFSKNGKKSNETSVSVTVMELNSKYIGTWAITETWTSDNWGNGSENYTITITAGSSGNEINISNFANLFNTNIHGSISGNHISIPLQMGIWDGGGSQWDVDDGLFTLNNNNSMTFTYQIDDILYDNSCGYLFASGTATKSSKKMTSTKLKIRKIN